MNTASHLSLALAQLWQLSLVIVVVGAVARTVCRGRPHWAYALWVLALVKCLTPPVWSSPTSVFSWAISTRAQVITPARDEPKPTTQLAGAGQAAPGPAYAGALAFQPPQRQATAAPAAPIHADEPPPRRISSGPAAIFGIWALGTLATLLVFARHAVKMRWQLRRFACDVPPGLSALLADLRPRIGTSRRVELVMSSEPVGPALVGFSKPRLLLPAALANDKSAETLAPIVAHELAHLRRGDHWLSGVQLLAQAAWWFHPLVWWMNREMNRAREMCCDEEVIAALDCDPGQYADTLLDVVRLRRQLHAPGFAPGMSPVQITAARLRHIMADRPRFHRRAPKACWAVAAIAAVVLLPGAGLALSGDSPTETNAPAEQAAAVTTAEASKPAAPASTVKLTFTPDKTDSQAAEPASMSWTIVDGTNGKAIAGAKVTVEHMIVTPAGRKVLATTEHLTDANGKYTVGLPVGEVAEPTLALLPRATHPGYADLGPVQYGYHYFRRNMRPGVKNPFDTQRMYPGEEVTGIIHDPQGRPVLDLPIKAFSTRTKKDIQPPASVERDEDDQSIGNFYVAGEGPVSSNTEVRTDAQGRFRFVALKSGTVQFAVEPHEFAAATTLLGDKRGDIGIVQLASGVRVTGRVLDVAGKPVPNVWVNMRRAHPRQPLDTTGDLTSRAAKTDGNGNFALEPVLPGQYRATIDGRDERSSMSLVGAGPLPAAFDPLILDVPAEGKLQPLENRAIPSATIDVQFVDSAGKPFAGGDLIIEGRRGPRPFSRHMRTDEQGKMVTALPRDLTQVRLYPLGDDDSAYRIRRGPNGELKNDHQINLGKLDHDVSDIFFVRYNAPTLWFKMLDPQGKPIAGFDAKGMQVEGVEAEIHYKSTAGRPPLPTDPFANAIPIGGTEWRTMGLLPDEEFTLTVKAPGLEPASHTLKLAEGETTKIGVQLAPPGPGTNDSSDAGAPRPQQSLDEILASYDRQRESQPAAEIIRSGITALRVRSSEVTEKHFATIDGWLADALKADKDSPLLLMELAELRDLQGREAEQIDLHRRLLRHPDVDARTRAISKNNLAFVLAMRGKQADLPEAEKLANEAVAFFDSAPDVLNTRSIVFLAKGDIARARADAKAAIAGRSSPTMYLHLAMIEEKAGDNAAMSAALAQALAMNLDASQLSPRERKAFERLRARDSKGE
jgi:beta-lactamase regulating signal transducer with metallopeptidase domain